MEAEYDIPENAWYFTANGSPYMPYAVLLEVALQPCGWTAAYMGSALKSAHPLKFRNLGGKAVLHGNIHRLDGTLATRVQVTQVSAAGDMIIEHFRFEVRCGARTVFSGTTYFGFFTPQALSDQQGLQDADIGVFSAGPAPGDRPYPLEDRDPMTPLSPTAPEAETARPSLV